MGNPEGKMHYDEHVIAWMRFRFMVFGGWYAVQSARQVEYIVPNLANAGWALPKTPK
jgi:hypothetical protein